MNPAGRRKKRKEGFTLFVCWDDSHDKARKNGFFVFVSLLYFCFRIYIRRWLLSFVVDEIANRVSPSFSARPNNDKSKFAEWSTRLTGAQASSLSSFQEGETMAQIINAN